MMNLTLRPFKKHNPYMLKPHPKPKVASTHVMKAFRPEVQNQLPSMHHDFGGYKTVHYQIAENSKPSPHLTVGREFMPKLAKKRGGV